MSGYRRIVVAFDGSPSAEAALALALRLRDPVAGTIVLTCVVPSRPWHVPGHPVASDDAIRDAREMLTEARDALPAGIRTLERTPVATSTARGLTELAEAEHAELIAIGSAVGATNGRIGLARTASRLLQGAPCAVAIAPPGHNETGPFRHVGAALDGSPEAAAALTVAYGIAAAGGAAMTLFSAMDPVTDQLGAEAPQYRLEIQQRLVSAADAAPAGVNPQTTLLHGAAGRVIPEACDGVVDLLVAGSRGYGPLERAFLGSVSEELIARATYPVLIIPRQPAPDASAPAVAEAAEAG